MLFFCTFCGKNKSGLSYLKFDDPYYNVSSCCSALICDDCVKSRRPQKCMTCSTPAAFSYGMSKNGYRSSSTWENLYQKYEIFHVFASHRKFRYLIPLTATGRFGRWNHVAEILGNPSHPDFLTFLEKYKMFVDDFFSAQLLFYTLRSEPMRRLIGLRTKTTYMLFFFKIVDDMAKFSQFSRKKVLHRNQSGFILILLRRLQIDKKFLVILHKNILAKKLKLPNE